MTVGTRFLEQSRVYLTGEYLPKIRLCCAKPSDERRRADEFCVREPAQVESQADS